MKEHNTNIVLSTIRVSDMRQSTTLEKAEEHQGRPYLVAGKWDEQKWLVIPFSTEAAPLTRGEMATGLDSPYAVLESWNAQTVPSDVLSRGWEIKKVDESIRIDAYDLFRHLVTGTPFMESFCHKIGPSIKSKEVPGWKHQVNDRDIMVKEWRELALHVIGELDETSRFYGNDDPDLVGVNDRIIKSIETWLEYYSVLL